MNYKPGIHLISDEFVIPQLNKKRRIWALLPHNYDSTSERYPVLYLQDAQNLFDENSTYGNWAIDVKMALLAKEGKGDLIIIAVDHGGSERIKEYSPYYHRDFGKGEGVHYAKFITETLKPYVDQNFRTKTDREYNGIGGSSMGGLISAYTGLVYPQYFSKMMIFSPSFWFSDHIYFNAFNHNYTMPLRMYIYGGELESEFMKQHIYKFKEAVQKGECMGISNSFKIEINPKGLHHEHDWSKVFPRAVKWLFFEK